MNSYFIAIAAILLITSFSFSNVDASQFEAPKKQIKYTHPTNITCNENLILSFKYDLTPLCMKLSSVTEIQKRNPEYFSLFDLNSYNGNGFWIKQTGIHQYAEEPWAFYSLDKPRPVVGTVWWQDENTKHNIKYMMINGTDLDIASINNLQNPSNRHTWPLEIIFTGDENTIIILQIPDYLELKNAVGMHMEQFDRQHILFPFVETENKTDRQIIISDVPNEEGLVFVELAFLKENHPYEITEIPLPIGEKYISENSINLDNIPKISCEIMGNQYKNNQCLMK